MKILRLSNIVFKNGYSRQDVVTQSSNIVGVNYSQSAPDLRTRTATIETRPRSGVPGIDVFCFACELLMWVLAINKTRWPVVRRKTRF